MADQRRTYTMQRRAQTQDQTRIRITESAVELHGTLGPSRTSISAIAAHAGVRRSTVYRHFPDEVALFNACSAHWATNNPVPDIAAWGSIADPDERLQVALRELYGFYTRNESMLENLFRDEHAVEAVQNLFAGFRAYLEAVRDALLVGRKLRGAARRRVGAALGHAVTFSTWKSLVRDQGLADHEAIALMRVATAGAS